MEPREYYVGLAKVGAFSLTEVACTHGLSHAAAKNFIHSSPPKKNKFI
jgi:hypothetical protein